MGENTDAVGEISERLRPLSQRAELQLVILFGSQASGEARSESDIDLAILGEGPLDLTPLTAEAIRLLKTSRVDLVDLYRASPLLKREVVRKGKLLYEKRPGAYLDFSSLAVRRYIDTQKLRDARKDAIERFLEQRGLA
ncbi:MAG: nucleotidyltransferase domain-containing protein [Nitrospirae bacterium]|nr:nucleotidyltransferase domain-containing protein [Candidatus Manganitrophaceae bacterium]